MTLQVKQYIGKPLIVLFCIKRRMDKGYVTVPSDIVDETGLSKKAVYHHVSDLEKRKVVRVIRENLKNIKNIMLTPRSIRELYDQTLEFLLQATVRKEVQQVIKHHDIRKKVST